MKTKAPLVTVPSWPVLLVEGPDAATWLNGLLTCDTLLVQPGRGNWGLLLNKAGKIQAELQLVGRSDQLYLGIAGGDREELYEALDRYLVMEDAEVSRVEDRGWLCFYGEGASELALELSDQSALMPWLGEGQAAVWLGPIEERERLLSVLKERNLVCEGNEWDVFRTERGLPLFGVDFSSRDNPHEASLERRVVAWSKGCYLGQEVVCMQDMRGKVKRRLVVLEGEGMDWTAGAAVFVGEEEVGDVTTAGPRRAIARVKVPHYAEGTEVLVAGKAARVVARTQVASF